ncbi:homeodomain transcription factor [Lithospermum erythrorhizon]|uniref:Protein WUSCHEL n=1 Tax=Lithospermum erythrorhizon TaxID=34254 RepID=A0AAV3RFU4_LITER
MASSNRHWPSMFKSKPCTNTHHHQWQHDITNNSTNNSSLLSSNACHKASYSSGCEERSPEPKPRWNPRPEQIRILEAIFNSGMVNPPRDEIRKIRAQLQEYGQVGDANVFYWFQNRKSRSKHKQRQLQSKQAQSNQQPHNSSSPLTSITTTIRTHPTSTSSNSSDKSSPSSFGSKNLIDISNNSPTASVNNQQSFLQAQSEFLTEPFFSLVQQPNTPQGSTPTNLTQGFCFPDIMTTVSHIGDQSVAPCGPGLFLNDLQVNMNHQEISKKVNDLENMKLQEEQLIFPLKTASTTSVPSTTTQIQGIGVFGGICATKSTVFINDVAFEVPVGPFNVKGSFGDDAVLFHSSGHPVLADEWGITLQPLQHGAFYFLLRTTGSTSIAHNSTIHLVIYLTFLTL